MVNQNQKCVCGHEKKSHSKFSEFSSIRGNAGKTKINKYGMGITTPVCLVMKCSCTHFVPKKENQSQQQSRRFPGKNVQLIPADISPSGENHTPHLKEKSMSDSSEEIGVSGSPKGGNREELSNYITCVKCSKVVFYQEAIGDYCEKCWNENHKPETLSESNRRVSPEAENRYLKQGSPSGSPKGENHSQRKKDATSSTKKHLEPQLLSGEENVVDKCQNNEVNHSDTIQKEIEDKIVEEVRLSKPHHHLYLWEENSVRYAISLALPIGKSQANKEFLEKINKIFYFELKDDFVNSYTLVKLKEFLSKLNEEKGK